MVTSVFFSSCASVVGDFLEFNQANLNGHGFGWTPEVGDGQGRPGVLRFMGLQRVRHD